MKYDKEFFEKEIYINSNRLKEKFIFNNYHDFYLFIIENYKGESFLQRLYNFYKGDHKCYCGNNTKFIDFKKGYLKFCSITCSSNNEETKEKYKKTCLDKYGVNNVSKSIDIKKSKEKKSYEKYGVSTPLQSDHVKEKIIAKYGVDNPFKLKNIQDKIKYQSMVQQVEINCLTKSRRQVYAGLLSESMGNGKLVFEFKEPKEWIPIIPNKADDMHWTSYQSLCIDAKKSQQNN